MKTPFDLSSCVELTFAREIGNISIGVELHHLDKISVMCETFEGISMGSACAIGCEYELMNGFEALVRRVLNTIRYA